MDKKDEKKVNQEDLDHFVNKVLAYKPKKKDKKKHKSGG